MCFIVKAFAPPSHRKRNGAIPLRDPTDASDVQKEFSTYDEEVWIWIYKILTLTTLAFLVLNIFQVAFIHTYNNYEWITGAPVALFALFSSILAIEACGLRVSLPKRSMFHHISMYMLERAPDHN